MKMFFSHCLGRMDLTRDTITVPSPCQPARGADDTRCTLFRQAWGVRAQKAAPRHTAARGAEDGDPLPPNEDLYTILREASTLSDQQARREMYEQANELITEVVPAVPIVHRSPPLIFQNNVTGYVPSPIQILLTTVAKQ